MVLVEGITYMHEHTTIDLSRIKNIDDTNLNCFEETVAEYKKLYTKGVRNIVDVTVMDMKRNPLYVQKAAEASGINIIQATGFYTERFLPEIVDEYSTQQLAELMVKEIEEGIADTSIKAQIIGEIGSSKDGWTEREKKVFNAAVIAHKKTGTPITTHTTLGTFGHEQVAFFKENGVELSKVVIGHVDLSGSGDYVLHMLEQGVYVEFDTVGKENYLPDIERVKMLQQIEAAGYTDRVFLSMDITRKSNLEYQNGIGYSYILDVFVPLMKENGISESFIQKMLVTNPQKFFSDR
ncbi:phosphotriesterase family protein [Enterococcus sp. BWR-S5]|uniref:phosphotriesterase family protein n=1 Tax=Enterococcus sp. BWR-S5 TaxID=2787714 RepID=UPI001923786B|nr:phosphotriesterase-related protein [Enterococcus sp. BWR-S5]MBL1226546.1 phosphotriesterase-related protein [Enterococcus sp. BWR-S5]